MVPVVPLVPALVQVPPEPRQLSVLVVNDDFFQKNIISQLFDRANFITTTADNGLEAYEAVQERLRQNTPMFDLILTDLQMPIMDGLESSGKINELFANQLFKARNSKNKAPPLILLLTANSITANLKRQASD